MENLYIGKMVQYAYSPSENVVVTLPAVVVEVVDEVTCHLCVFNVNAVFHKMKVAKADAPTVGKWNEIPE